MRLICQASQTIASNRYQVFTQLNTSDSAATPILSILMLVSSSSTIFSESCALAEDCTFQCRLAGSGLLSMPTECSQLRQLSNDSHRYLFYPSLLLMMPAAFTKPSMPVRRRTLNMAAVCLSSQKATPLGHNLSLS